MHASQLSDTPSPNPSLPQTELVRFNHSPIHGQGVFAKIHIPGGACILEYKGEIIDKKESARRCEQNNVYIFSLNDRHDIDGNVDWNPARFVNHSCSPNCEAVLEEDHIWLIASRDIKAGEELLFNYGFDVEDYRDYPCRCGSPNCVGFIVAEEFFDHVRKQMEGTTCAQSSIEQS
jgi:SET domain-containing protein